MKARGSRGTRARRICLPSRSSSRRSETARENSRGRSTPAAISGAARRRNLFRGSRESLRQELAGSCCPGRGRNGRESFRRTTGKFRAAPCSELWRKRAEQDDNRKRRACGEQQQADAEQGNVILRFVFRRVCRFADEYERQSKKRFRRDKIPDESQRTYCGEKQDDMRKNFFPVLE